jgi:hypothetical protein
VVGLQQVLYIVRYLGFEMEKMPGSDLHQKYGTIGFRNRLINDRNGGFGDA